MANEPPRKKNAITETRNITPTRLWSRVFSHDITVVASRRWVGAGPAPAPRVWLPSADRSIDRSLRRADFHGVALQRFHVFDERGDLRPGELVLVAGHHRLVARDDLGERIHDRPGHVALVHHHRLAGLPLLPSAVPGQ